MSEHENFIHSLLMPVPYEKEPAVTWKTWASFVVFVTMTAVLALAILIGCSQCLDFLARFSV